MYCYVVGCGYYVILLTFLEIFFFFLNFFLVFEVSYKGPGHIWSLFQNDVISSPTTQIITHLNTTIT